MIIAINYADERFAKQQKYNAKTAYSIGRADKVIQYGYLDLDDEFKNKNKNILSQARGGGYWIWKPYIILKTLNEIADYGDYVLYCDSGSYFVNKIEHLIKAMEKENTDIMSFELPLMEKQWTKKETFVLMESDNYDVANSNQILATFILVKKSNRSIDFIKEYLKYCCNEKIVIDDYNVAEQCREFITHRNDQSVLSLLIKKYKIQPFRDPSQYGDRHNAYAEKDRWLRYKNYENSCYPRIIMSQRTANLHTFKIKEFIKDNIYKILFIFNILKK